MAAPVKTTLQLESRKSVDLKLSQVMTNGKLEILPNVTKEDLLFLQFRKGAVTLSAGKYIGLIPLTAEIQVEVRPKMPVSNLARILDMAGTSIVNLGGVERIYEKNYEKSISVLEFLLLNLVDALNPVRTFGLLKRYHAFHEVGERISGRVLLNETMSKCFSRGIGHKVATSSFAQTSNIPENRAIKSALCLALTALSRSTHDAGITRRGNEAALFLNEQIEPLRPGDLNIVREIVEERSLPAQRDYYYRPLEIALTILTGNSVSLEVRGVDLSLDTFIIDFEAVFERYLRQCVRSLVGTHIQVRDGNEEGKKPLFDDRTEPTAQPDIVVKNLETGRLSVAEIKYKDKPNRDDINQAIAYAVAYRTDRVVLVHQRKAGAARLRRIGMLSGITLDAYGFDLASGNLAAEEEALSSFLVGLTLDPAVPA